MWAFWPDLVRTDALPTLKSADFDASDMAEWRQGREHALHKTPLGYLGDPEAGARQVAEARTADRGGGVTPACGV